MDTHDFKVEHRLQALELLHQMQEERIKVALEDLRNRFKNVDEKVDDLIVYFRGGKTPRETGIATELALIASKQSAVDEKLDKLMKSLEPIVGQLSQHTQQFVKVESDIESLREDLHKLETKVQELEKAAKPTSPDEVLSIIERTDDERIRRTEKWLRLFKDWTPWVLTAIITILLIIQGRVVNLPQFHNEGSWNTNIHGNP